MRSGLLTLVIDCVPVAIAHLVPVEVRGIDMPSLGMVLAPMRHGTVIAMLRMETVIHPPVEMLGAMKPGTHTNESAIHEPFRAVITLWCASVRRHIVVTIRTDRFGTNTDTHLGLGLRSRRDKSGARDGR